jgi:hypothetical protein
MSEINESVELDDAFFDAYSKKVKADSEKKASEGGYPAAEYDEIGYTGCEKGNFRIVRLIGAPIGAESQGYKRKPYDPKEILTCEVKDDEGKRFTIKLPLRQPIAADNHILIRMYDKVCEKTKINGEWVFVNKNKPGKSEIFEAMTKGGFKPEDGKTYQYSSGYKCDKVSIYNVIDRDDNWCKENKHTKILCRDLNIDEQGRAWAKPGIKSFGSVQKIATLLGKYGSFEKYDIGLKKTGLKENPWEIVNASRLKEKEMLEDLGNDDGSSVDESKIVIGPLTDEERSYERYDLDKLYQPTTYQKIQKRISGLFKLYDAQMGTHFTEELAGLVEKEKAYFAEKYAKTENEETVKQEEAEKVAIQESLETEETPVSEAPVTRSRRSAAPTEETTATISADKIALLKGWQYLPAEIKARIVDVVEENGKTQIVWDRKDDLLVCDDCGAFSPEEGVTHCPVCGTSF